MDKGGWALGNCKQLLHSSKDDKGSMDRILGSIRWQDIGLQRTENGRDLFASW